MMDRTSQPTAATKPASHLAEPGFRDQPWTPEIASRAVGGSTLHAVFLHGHDVTLLPCRAPRPIGGMTAGITAVPFICTQVPASRPGPPYPRLSCALTQSSSVVVECKASGVGGHDRFQVESLHVSAATRSPVRMDVRATSSQKRPRKTAEDRGHKAPSVRCLLAVGPADRLGLSPGSALRLPCPCPLPQLGNLATLSEPVLRDAK